MVSPRTSTTDLVALFDELVLSGEAPDPEAFSAAHPHHPTLLSRLQHLAELRRDLEKLFGPKRAALSSITKPEVPGFNIIGPLGAGGMGTVYLAQQFSPKRLCALKLMDRTLPAAQDRFRREANLAARLNHHGIATVYAFGVANGQTYLATEMVHGFSLRELLQAADLVSPDDPSDWFVEAVRRVSEGLMRPAIPTSKAPVSSMVELATQIADALSHAHVRGVIHRDVKPSNVIVALDGRAKLIDFGIAVTTAGNAAEGERVTRTGTFIGSQDYAAPEQLRGEHEAVGSWTDTYALGATLFEMLSQRTPFEAATYADRLATAAIDPPNGPRHFNSKVPRELDALVMRALHPDPHMRFHDGEELADALRRCPKQPSLLPGLPTRWLIPFLPRTPTKLAAVLATTASVAFGTLYLSERSQHDQTKAQWNATELLGGHAVMELVLRDEQNDLKQCLRFDRRIASYPVHPARFVADLTVRAGVVTRATPAKAIANLGIRTQQCMLERLRGLELPGVGMAKTILLRLDVKFAPSDIPAPRR